MSESKPGGVPGRGRNRPPVMADVARLAGVSAQTVSRALSGHHQVAPATRAAVLEAVNALGYRLNGAARTLSSGRSRNIGVLSVSGTLHGPASNLFGIEEAAARASYSVLVSSVRAVDTGSVMAAVTRLTEQGVDGLIAIAGVGQAGARAARDLGLPFVAIEGPERGRVASVNVDQRYGGTLATEHLLELGHHNVWHIAGPSTWPAAAERAEGWRSALMAVGATPPEPLVGDWSASSGFAHGVTLAGMRDVTAIFVANDQMALGVLQAMHQAGRRVPRDVSVVGFDDIPEAAHLIPALTTVRQDFADVGRRSFLMLLEQMESGREESPRLVMTPRLVVRASTAHLRGA